jgi:hypothetical protein
MQQSTMKPCLPAGRNQQLSNVFVSDFYPKLNPGNALPTLVAEMAGGKKMSVKQVRFRSFRDPNFNQS